MSIIDHANLPVTDLARARRFYDLVMAELGCQVVAEDGPAIGYGADGNWQFGIIETRSPFAPLHLAFAASSRAVVDQFHKAAIDAGAQDNGAPGLRPQYHADYYAAFVIDPDGHNIEAVFRG